MKARSSKVTLLAALAVLGLGFAAAPTSAEAGGCQTRLSHHCGSCRGPVYQSSIIVGYQRCGAPIFRWVAAPHTCRHNHSHSRFHSHGRTYRPSFGYGNSYSRYRSGGISIGISTGYRSPFGYRSYSRCR